MVSKVAVIALVAIIAVPIMLGYAMNLEQVTETDYKATTDAVNVTQLLQNNVRYDDAQGDSYQLNSKFGFMGSSPMFPIFQSVTTNKSSLELSQRIFVNGGIPYALSSSFSFYSLYTDYNGTGGYVDMIFLDAAYNPIHTISHLVTVYYDGGAVINYTYYSNGTILTGAFQPLVDDWATIFQVGGGSYTSSGYLQYVDAGNTYYADISQGYYFEGGTSNWRVKLPDYTKSILLTMDLNSITADNYSMYLNFGASIILQKSTADGVVTWTAIDNANPTRHIDLYYNPTGDNTYQILYSVNKSRDDGSHIFYDVNLNFRYVGKWPIAIGAANYYQSNTLAIGFTTQSGNPFPNLNNISFYNTTGENRTPVIRVDDAIFRGYTYPIIEDVTYNPADFKTNPSTMIKDPAIYGYSLSFGGNTYIVTGGKITIGTHQIPVKDLILSSVPNAEGGYDNMIGNTVISTTAQPSTITFNGQWSASISTTAQEEYEYTKTEWIAGGFAWDGIDHNFLMVGLITCLGVFVALGIYARRSGARVLPLMIVCGGAALLFFVML